MRGGKEWEERVGKDSAGGRSSPFLSLQRASLPLSLSPSRFSLFPLELENAVYIRGV